MKKFLKLFSFAIFFMYVAFAVNHYLEAQWFEMPTRILAICLTAIHIALICLHLYSEAHKPKDE